mmetsp:Transcript_40560/g.87052  ORF Transcript_40560/g.87052 Transcript_40560/m.87052 type:complete len:204 (-) Transcript_40560:847-1458(-)
MLHRRRASSSRLSCSRAASRSLPPGSDSRKLACVTNSASSGTTLAGAPWNSWSSRVSSSSRLSLPWARKLNWPGQAARISWLASPGSRDAVVVGRPLLSRPMTQASTMPSEGGDAVVITSASSREASASASEDCTTSGVESVGMCCLGTSVVVIGEGRGGSHSKWASVGSVSTATASPAGCSMFAASSFNAVGTHCSCCLSWW